MYVIKYCEKGANPNLHGDPTSIYDEAAKTGEAHKKSTIISHIAYRINDS